jgi:hypothetical protein
MAVYNVINVVNFLLFCLKVHFLTLSTEFSTVPRINAIELLKVLKTLGQNNTAPEGDESIARRIQKHT